jgi:hypothetical protein
MPETDTATAPTADAGPAEPMHPEVLAERLRVTLPVLVDEYGLAGVLNALALLYPDGLPDTPEIERITEWTTDVALAPLRPVELPGAVFVNPEEVVDVRPYESTDGWQARVDAGVHAIMFAASDQSAAVALVRELVSLIWPVQS